MKTTKEQRATYRSLFAESQSPLASFVKQMIDGLEAAEAEIARMREFITYWSYCTYTGMLRSCPEKQNELREALASCGVEPYRQAQESERITVSKEEYEWFVAQCNKPGEEPSEKLKKLVEDYKRTVTSLPDK